MKLSLEIKGKSVDNKPDVVLIHGTGSYARMWETQMDELVDRGHRCLAPDLRGHGKTGELYQATNLEAHIEDVLETLEEYEVAFPCVFVGHSLGAIISLRLANNHAQLTKSVFLAALPGRVYKPVSKAFKHFLNGPFQTISRMPIKGALPWRHKVLLETDVHSLNEIVENFEDLDLVSEQFQINCPVHLSCGKFDPVAPYVYVQQIHQAIPHSTLKVFELGGHNFMDYNKKSFNNWIRDYIDLETEHISNRADEVV